MTVLPVIRERSLVLSFFVSMVSHAAIGLIILWRFSMFASPVATVDAGRGGDSVAQGAVISTQSEATQTLLDPLTLPSVSPDIANKNEIVSTAEPDSVLQSDTLPIFQSAPKILTVTSNETDLIGPFPQQDLTVPNELPRSFISKFSPQSNKRGDGGLGGDGLIRGTPTPSASNKPPRYPSEARRLAQEGTVILQIEVLRDGKVGKITIASSSGYVLLDDAAVQAVRGWRFQPAFSNGQSAACEVRLQVPFVLSE